MGRWALLAIGTQVEQNICPRRHPPHKFLANRRTRQLALGEVFMTTRASRFVGVNSGVPWQSVILLWPVVFLIVTRPTGWKTERCFPLGVSRPRSCLSGSLTPMSRWLVRKFSRLSSLGSALGTVPVRTQLLKWHLFCSRCRIVSTCLAAQLGSISMVSERNRFLTQPWWQNLTASLVSLWGAKAVWGILPDPWPM